MPSKLSQNQSIFAYQRNTAEESEDQMIAKIITRAQTTKNIGVYLRWDVFCNTWTVRFILYFDPPGNKIPGMKTNFEANYSPLYEDFFDDLGINWLLFFQEKTAKIKSNIFNTYRHIFNHIGSAQRRFFSQFSILSPYKEIRMKNSSKSFFLQIFENFRKKVHQNPQQRSRCSYERRKKCQISIIRVFFTSAKVAPDCNAILLI